MINRLDIKVEGIYEILNESFLKRTKVQVVYALKDSGGIFTQNHGYIIDIEYFAVPNTSFTTFSIALTDEYLHYIMFDDSHNADYYTTYKASY